MIVYILILLFYSSGTYLAISQSGSELSLWFLTFGLVLDIAMLFFDWVGAKYAPRLGEGDLTAKVMRLLAFFLWGLAFSAHSPKIESFKVIVGVAFAIWLAFFVRSLILYLRKSRRK